MIKNASSIWKDTPVNITWNVGVNLATFKQNLIDQGKLNHFIVTTFSAWIQFNYCICFKIFKRCIWHTLLDYNVSICFVDTCN